MAPGCTYNFYAACYRQTSNNAIAACTESDAIGCAWNFPANSVTMRTYNSNEEFFNNAETDENDQIMKARSFVAVTPIGKQNAIVVDYANDGGGPPRGGTGEHQSSDDNLLRAVRRIDGRTLDSDWKDNELKTKDFFPLSRSLFFNHPSSVCMKVAFSQVTFLFLMKKSMDEALDEKVCQMTAGLNR